MSLCNSCEAPIIWATHARTGKAAPIDAAPSAGGNVMLTGDGDKITYTLLTKEAAALYQGGDAHRNHFATCPDAASHKPDTTEAENPCPHEDFVANVTVNRIQDGNDVTIAFSADVTIHCAKCDEAFVWIGTPTGLLASRPCTSIDQRELRAPIRPESADLEFGLNIPGFTVRIKEGR